MKNGTMTKNLGDGLLVAMVLFAAVLIALAFVGFEEGGYLIEHPATGEIVDVSAPLDDPYNKSTVLMLIAFLIASAIGLSTRRVPTVSVGANVLLFALCLIEAARGLFGFVDFPFTLCSAIALAASIVYTVCFYLERAEERKPKENA